MTDAVLTVAGLRKSFGDVPAVQQVSFSVAAGEIFGLLGPNGAGKTTTISCICGLLRPDAGEVKLSGIDAGNHSHRVRARLGVAPQELALYDELTVEQNLRCFAEMYRVRRSDLRARLSWCLQLARLEDARQRRVEKLSGGMKRRLNLAVALMHDPDVILADEPTVGVDPQSRNHIFANIEQLARAGKAVVYTTHYMEEVERLCGRAAIVDRGRVVASDTIPGLLGLAGQMRRVRLGWSAGPPPESLVGQLRERFAPAQASVEGAELHLAFAGVAPVSALVCWLQEAGHPVAEVSMERPTLEDAFLNLTGRQLRDY